MSDAKGNYKHNRNYSESYKVLDTPVGEEESSPTKEDVQQKNRKTGQKVFSGFFSKLRSMAPKRSYRMVSEDESTNTALGAPSVAAGATN